MLTKYEFSKMLLQNVTNSSLSISLRSMQQCVCLRSFAVLSLLVLCSKICTRVALKAKEKQLAVHVYSNRVYLYL